MPEGSRAPFENLTETELETGSESERSTSFRNVGLSSLLRSAEMLDKETCIGLDQCRVARDRLRRALHAG